MKPFREQNQVTIGVIGLTVIGLIMLAAFKAQDLPLIGGGTKYSAQFSEAGGLKANDEIRVAGVRVGKVRGVELEGTHVRVDFVVDQGVKLGDQTGAEMKIKTLLGQKYLKLDPAGSGQLKPGAEIPLARTTSAYDVVDAFTDLANTTDRINTAQLAKALDTLSATFKNTPDEVRASLTGLSRLSQNVAKRDEQLKLLLQNSNVVTKILADRNQQLIKLMKDGNTVFQAVQARRALIHQLLVSTQALSAQITALVRENRKDLAPTLQKVNAVLAVLLKNQNDLDASIKGLAPFVRVFTNTLGTGPWFDTYLQNLAPVPEIPLPKLLPPGLPPILGGGG
ncbi:MCE family protein [Kribbella solani]|uniref:MCE family protein n=1 Tax=Kribbella solani TaxID=236067 RepID=UPI0029BA170B|nr:MCE family protein [Kribbella solani]MDX2971698.1 MCE family protein [Kribbella solani]